LELAQFTIAYEDFDDLQPIHPWPLHMFLQGMPMSNWGQGLQKV
jgi:hypothetical protein